MALHWFKSSPSVSKYFQHSVRHWHQWFGLPASCWADSLTDTLEVRRHFDWFLLAFQLLRCHDFFPLISSIEHGTYILWACTNLCFISTIYLLGEHTFTQAWNQVIWSLDALLTGNALLIPETCHAALENIGILFETNPTWMIGATSNRNWQLSWRQDLRLMILLWMEA